MKNALIVIVAILLGGAAGLFSNQIFSTPARPHEPDGPGLAEELSQLSRAAQELRRGQEELRAAVEKLRMAPAPAAARAPQISQVDLERAVASYMSENASGSPQTGRGDSPADDGMSLAAAPLDDIMDMLTDGILSGMEEQEFWDGIRRAGRMDEVLAEYEKLASMQPNNPDVQTELGNVYLQKIFDVAGGPLAGKYGNLADEAYDRALEADPTHWEARFTKAVALSNWPEFLGKTGEAIQELETLVAQQETQAVESRHEQTYFILGNMYQRKGDTEKALETWKKGLVLFPDSETLREQLRMNQ